MVVTCILDMPFRIATPNFDGVRPYMPDPLDYVWYVTAGKDQVISCLISTRIQ